MKPGEAVVTVDGGQIARLEEAEKNAGEVARLRDQGTLRFEELASWVRHNKGKLLGDALAMLPDGKFDEACVKAQYVSNFGTQYMDSLNGPAFHMNKTDDNGNTLLHISAQNGRKRVLQQLLKKGANPNHQNMEGNTALHYAMAYKFHEMAAWLADPEKGGADDSIQNSKGGTAYDGLES